MPAPRAADLLRQLSAEEITKQAVEAEQVALPVHRLDEQVAALQLVQQLSTVADATNGIA